MENYKSKNYERFPTVDWRKKWINAQHIEPNYYDSILKNKNLEKSIFGEKNDLINVYKYGTGTGIQSFAIKVTFAYLGGLIVARRQYITGFLYFNNNHFNWIKASNFIFGGYILGCMFSSFAMGYPFIIEDKLRGMWRKWTYTHYLEYFNWYAPNHLQYQARDKDPFVFHESQFNKK